MGGRSVTLSDVARRAGVSRTTASYILNGRADEMRIAGETQARVRRAVEDLGYRPNRVARNLRTSSTKTIGLLSDHVASGLYASQMLAGASEVARQTDHLVIIGESGGDPELEALLIEEMIDRKVDGIVYVRVVASTVSVPRALAGGRVVLLNCVDEDTELPAVLPDDLGGGRTAAAALLAAGFTDGVYVVGEDPTPNAIAGRLRLEGLRARFAEAGSTPPEVIPCPWSVQAAYEAVHTWLSAGGRPAALVCLNDRVALGTYQALAAHGLAVPADVSVVSFDGSELATWLRPPVSSVALPFAELGREAVRLLLHPGKGGAGVVRLPMPLVTGASVRPAERPAERPAGVVSRGGSSTIEAPAP